jgi:inorganic pyrophosphatase
MYGSEEFWHYIDQLVADSAIIVDRPQGSSHPHWPELIYPLNYGYLENTTSGDGQGIDVWIGSHSGTSVNGIVCTVDLWKRDIEIKLLIGCTDNDIETIEQFLNSGSLRCTVLKRSAD